MARLEYTIQGNNTGLISATDQAIANIENLTSAVNTANVSLQFKNGVAALDKLGQQLLVAQGNASLFGDSIKLQTQQLNAYQGALNTLLANGFDPANEDVLRLKTNIDALNESLKTTSGIRVPQISNSTAEVQAAGNNSTDPSLTGAFVQSPSVGQLQERLAATKAAIQQLNEVNAQGTISAETYSNAISVLTENETRLTAAINNYSAAQENIITTVSEVTAATKTELGAIEGLQLALQELKAIQITSPIAGLPALNAEIQETEVSIKQLSNIGKQGFDQLGNSIKGVSLQSVNGQLISMSNNLFGARQISRDFARSFSSDTFEGLAKNLSLLIVDFLYYAQGAQFAAAATTTATTAIAAEGTVATGAALSTGALGAAFATLLTPATAIILGIGLLVGGLIAYKDHEAAATKAVSDHLTALRQEKQALDEYIQSLSAQQQVEAQAAQKTAENTTELNKLLDALDNSKGSLQGQAEAFDNLQGKFPEYFSGINQAQIGTDAFAKAVNNAKTGLADLALAAAAFTLSENSAVDSIKQQVALNGALKERATLQKQYDAAVKVQNSTLSVGGPQGVGTTADVRELGTALGVNANHIKDIKVALAGANAEFKSYTDLGEQYSKTAKDVQLPDNRIGFLQNEISDLEKVLPKAKDYEVVVAKIKADQAELNTLTKTGSTTTGTKANPFDTILNSLTEIGNKSAALANESGLQGYALEVQKITDKYIALNAELDIQQQKLDKANKAKNITPADKIKSAAAQDGIYKDRVSLVLAQDKEVSVAKINDATNTANEIQRINDEFGVKSEESRQKELDRIQARYDAEVVKAKGNVKILEALEADKVLAFQTINDKYFQQEVDLYTKINTLDQQATDERNNTADSETARINETFAKRLAIVNSYFEKVKTISKTGNGAVDAFNNLIINAQQSVVDTNLTTDQQQKIQLSISKPLIQGVGQFASSFYSTLTQINQQTDQSFKAIFADLIQSLNTSLNSIFVNILEKQLTSALENAIKNGTSTLFNKDGGLTTAGAVVAGAGIAGGLISGSTSKTSSVGQAAGGALSGAASGALIGSIIGPEGTLIGAGVGLVVGAIGGLLGASKAQKELQAQQLAQQQQQTALLKASVAYTSSIIGRMTANGVLTNVTVGSQGQLVATVSGSQLQFVLNRSASGR